MPCSSSCKTQDHASWGECVRSKGVNIGPNLMATGAQKKWDSELENYRKARAQGVQPDGTTQAKIDYAMKKSDEVGAAYGTDFDRATPMGGTDDA